MDAALWSQLGAGAATLDKLRAFEALVRKWTPHINLIAKSTLPDLWERHIEDSARLCLCAPSSPQLWVDLGSGGGFPGLVAAIVFGGNGSPTRFVLVESDQRKATFLREAARLLGLAVTVLTERAEVIAPLNADVLSARALTSLDGLCGLAARHLSPGGVALFPKGETHSRETAEAAENWRFDLETVVDPGHKGAILCMRSIERVRG